jgi:hypothetical protein
MRKIISQLGKIYENIRNLRSETDVSKYTLEFSEELIEDIHSDFYHLIFLNLKFLNILIYIIISYWMY